MVQFRAFRELRGETPENINKAISKPFKAIFLDPNLWFSSNIKDSWQIYNILFMQNKAIFALWKFEYYYPIFSAEFWLKCKAFAFVYTGVVQLYIED